jgi:hypothetical protein
MTTSFWKFDTFGLSPRWHSRTAAMRRNAPQPRWLSLSSLGNCLLLAMSFVAALVTLIVAEHVLLLVTTCGLLCTSLTLPVVLQHTYSWFSLAKSFVAALVTLIVAKHVLLLITTCGALVRLSFSRWSCNTFCSRFSLAKSFVAALVAFGVTQRVLLLITACGTLVHIMQHVSQPARVLGTFLRHFDRPTRHTARPAARSSLVPSYATLIVPLITQHVPQLARVLGALLHHSDRPTRPVEHSSPLYPILSIGTP